MLHAAIAFTFSDVGLSPPIAQSPLATSLIFTQVTPRMFSPSTETIASVTFSISCRFWSGVKTSPMMWISTSGMVYPPAMGSGFSIAASLLARLIRRLQRLPVRRSETTC
jgi:hypothetical protein